MPQPLFFSKISYVPAIEVALHRGLWSFIFLFSILFFLKKIVYFIIIFFSLKKIIILSLTALLISVNWTCFIFAVSIGRVQDASMGYFITPIISIGLGYFFLKEKITRLKIFSVLLMLASIIFLIYSLKNFPYIAILIGSSWGIYGLLRKQIDVSPEIGLLFESFFISFFAFPYLIYFFYKGSGYFLNYDSFTSVFLILTGAVTIFPLFFFNLGVKFIPLGHVGVIFYLAPTFHFITSVFILGETLILEKLICFFIIWIAIGIFIIDVLRNEKNIIENNTQ